MIPRWKKAGPSGELEIKFPTGRRFKIEKQLDEYERHKNSEWKVLEWDPRYKDWEWGDTYSPKAYAKQQAMDAGQYDKRGKKVADYSKTFQFESLEEVTTTADAGIPQDTANMGPRAKEIHVTDCRRKKNKLPVLLKRFRRHMEDNG